MRETEQLIKDTAKAYGTWQEEEKMPEPRTHSKAVAKEKFVEFENRLSARNEPDMRKYLGSHIVSIRYYAKEGRFTLASDVINHIAWYCLKDCAKPSTEQTLSPSDYVHAAKAAAYCIDKALERRDKKTAERFRGLLADIARYETRAAAHKK